MAIRVIILIPSSILAYCWKRGWWSRKFPTPEIIGLVIAAYIAAIISVGFTTVLNGTCGVRIPIVEGSVNIELSNDERMFELKNGHCDVFNATTGFNAGECSTVLEDRHTYFELNVFMWCGQMVLILFGFTSLFKPSFSTTVIYTAIVWMIAAVGCWYQGFGFWTDKDRVLNSGIFPAIFLFTSAAAVNIYSAHVMHDLELRLVISSHQLSDNRFQAPTGSKVVYVKAEVCGVENLQLEAGAGMDHAVQLMHHLVQQLGKEYFGTPITLDGERGGSFLYICVSKKREGIHCYSVCCVTLLSLVMFVCFSNVFLSCN
jgi:hypothetical protein